VDSEPGWQMSMVLRRTNWLLRARMVEIKGRALADAIRAKYNFDPNQPALKLRRMFQDVRVAARSG
jgi:hypothetical protein